MNINILKKKNIDNKESKFQSSTLPIAAHLDKLENDTIGIE